MSHHIARKIFAPLAEVTILHKRLIFCDVTILHKRMIVCDVTIKYVYFYVAADLQLSV
jgi:hypothetical protein